MHPLDEYLTAGEAAEKLGIHHNNVLKAVRQGRLKGTKKGRDVLIHRTELETYAAQRRKKQQP